MNLSLQVHTQRHWETEELDQIRLFLRAHRGEFDALASVGDVLAVAAIRCATELGIRVPEELPVISFNNIILASQIVPSLTTVGDPAEEMGRTAFRLLHERLSGERSPDDLRQVKLKPDLHVRSSTAIPVPKTT